MAGFVVIIRLTGCNAHINPQAETSIMPRVTHVKAARKDIPNTDIKAGDSYYHWSFRFGGKHCSKTKPRPSQLTQSKLSGAYAAQEDMADIMGNAAGLDEIAQACRDCAEAIREVAGEYRESKENMPEGLQEGEVGQRCEENADALEAYADEMDSAADDIDAMNLDEHVEDDREVTDFDDLADDEKTAALDAAREIANGPSLEI